MAEDFKIGVYSDNVEDFIDDNALFISKLYFYCITPYCGMNLSNCLHVADIIMQLDGIFKTILHNQREANTSKR